MDKQPLDEVMRWDIDAKDVRGGELLECITDPVFSGETTLLLRLSTGQRLSLQVQHTRRVDIFFIDKEGTIYNPSERRRILDAMVVENGVIILKALEWELVVLYNGDGFAQWIAGGATSAAEQPFS